MLSSECLMETIKEHVDHNANMVRQLASKRYYVLVVTNGAFLTGLQGPFEPTEFKKVVKRFTKELNEENQVAFILRLENGCLEPVPYNPATDKKVEW